METTLIIKGAYYFKGDCILMAHFTGMYFMVDCTEFRTKKDIKSDYSKEDAKRIFSNNNSIEYSGTTYYETGDYSPHYTEDMLLLSDLSDLQHNEESFNF